MSATSVVEIVYLHEKARIPHEAWDAFVSALGDPNFGFRVVPVNSDIALALLDFPREKIPDMRTSGASTKTGT